MLVCHEAYSANGQCLLQQKHFDLPEKKLEKNKVIKEGIENKKGVKF
jgi:hypothetical protein